MMALPLVVLGVSTAPLTLKLRVDPPELAHPFAEAAATLVDDDSYDVLWLMGKDEWQPANDKAARLANRVDAMPLITRKGPLATAGAALDWSFVPKLLTTDVAQVGSGGKDGLLTPYAYMLKGAAHHEVTPLEEAPRGAALERLVANGDIVQRRVADPLLVDGRAFDIGVYVLVSRGADASLRFSVFDDALLRFCTHEYLTPAQLRALDASDRAEAARRAWVVGDAYTHAWEMPSLVAHGLTRPDAHGREALTSHLRKERPEVAWSAVEAQMLDAVSQTLAAVAALQPGERPLAPRFELIRYDFQLDRAGTPWLLEVNSNPNMNPSSAGHAALLQRLAGFAVSKLGAIVNGAPAGK